MSYSEKEQLLLNELGSRIRILRIKNKMTQEELAFRCDLDRTYIGGIERGERNISYLNFHKIMTTLGKNTLDEY